MRKRKKIFKNNEEYLKWYKDNKEKVNILLCKVDEKIKIEYVLKEVEK